MRDELRRGQVCIARGKVEMLSAFSVKYIFKGMAGSVNCFCNLLTLQDFKSLVFWTNKVSNGVSTLPFHCLSCEFGFETISFSLSIDYCEVLLQSCECKISDKAAMPLTKTGVESAAFYAMLPHSIKWQLPLPSPWESSAKDCHAPSAEQQPQTWQHGQQISPLEMPSYSRAHWAFGVSVRERAELRHRPDPSFAATSSLNSEI